MDKVWQSLLARTRGMRSDPRNECSKACATATLDVKINAVKNGIGEWSS